MRTALMSTRRAFTLVELLVAISIVAIMAVTLFATLRIAFRARDTAIAAIAPSRTAELSLDLLRDDFTQAMPPRGVMAGSFEGTQATDDRGNEGDDIIFYTLANGPERIEGGNGEIKQVEITVEVPDGMTDHCLVRKVNNNLLSQVQELPDEEIICRGVWSFSVQYWDGTEWDPTWDSTTEGNTLPQAVMITLQLEHYDKDGQMQPIEWTRVFQIPCNTTTDDQPDTVATAATTGGSGGNTSGKTGTTTGGTAGATAGTTAGTTAGAR